MSDFQSIFGQGGFVTNSVAPAKDFQVVPPGKYPCAIEASEVKATKKQDGYYLELVLVILEGNYANSKLWDRINIANPSAKCQEIGRGTLAALGLALGIANFENESQAVGGVVIAHVKVKNEQNEVRTYSSLTDYRKEQIATPRAAAVQAPARSRIQADPATAQSPYDLNAAPGAGARQQQGATPWARPER